MRQSQDSHGKSHFFYFVLIILFFSGLFFPENVAKADGGAGWSLSFDGVNDYVWLGDTQEVFGGSTDWQDTKTVSLWVKPAGLGESCDRFDPAWCDSIFGDRPRWWGISRGIINSEDRIWIWNKPIGESIDVIGIPYTPDVWVHISLVHGDGFLQAYKNGTLIAELASGTTELPSTGAIPVLQLGAVINNVDRNWSFAGEIDEVRLYNIALTQQQIQDTLFTELVGGEIGLQAYYKMSDGTGVALTDDSGHGHDGVFYDGLGQPNLNGPQWVNSTAFDNPLAVDLEYFSNENEILNITLQGFSVDSSTLNYQIISQPAHGSLDGVAPDLSYTPDLNFSGTDSFTYLVNDGDSDSELATVTIFVGAVNHAPTANPDSYSINLNQTLNVDAPGVLENDNDTDGDSMTAIINTSTDFGQLTLFDNGSFQYIPDQDFNGIDTFTYYASDGSASSEVTSVSIEVLQTSIPTADSMDLFGTEDTDLPITLSGSSSGTNDLIYSYSDPAYGVLTGNAPNLVYTPNENYYGTDSFTYWVNDGENDSLDALVTITIDPVNDAPTAVADFYDVANNQTTLTRRSEGILINDYDIENDRLSAVLDTNPTNGQLVLYDNGAFEYTPDTDFIGIDSFTYHAVDELLSQSEAVSVTLNVTGDGITPGTFKVFVPLINK